MTAPLTAGEGNVSADALFRQHAPFVARFLYRLGVRPDEIEDAVQEVFLVAHRQGGYRPGPAKPASYLANLAVHAASEHRRRQRARTAREADEVVDGLASGRSDPVQVLETHESLRRLQSALDRLDPDLRTTLVLVELEGETCASVATAMGIPVGTVYWRLHQARKKFQRALETIETAARPRRAIAVQAATLAGGLRPARKDRSGMFILLMTAPSWMHSEARDLLRFGAARAPVTYAVQEGLARHLELVASGAPLPSWAHKLTTASAVAKSAGWVAASMVTAAVGTALVILMRPGAQAPSWPAHHVNEKTASGSQAAPVQNQTPFATAWRPFAAPDSMAAAPAVPVEALPLAAPTATARLAAVRGAGDSGRDPARRAPDALDPSGRGELPAPPQPDPARASSDPDELLELQEVAQAERLLATDPARALALVRAAEARFPRGYVREERGYVEVMALVGLGRLDEARPRMAQFLRDYPDSAFSRRVHEASRPAHLEP
jgi:RNA polymerase sigma-70 factor (ECF subfamily)